MQRSLIGSGQWWYGLVAKDQQREMRATEEIEKSDLFGAFSTDTERIWSTISSADARRVIQVARKSAPSIGQAQLSDIGEGFLACEKCLEGLVHIVLESPMADGTGSQDTLGDREPFGLIGVQQGVRCIIFQDVSQLPAKVIGILHAGIHPLPTSSRMHMRRVACEEDSADTIAVNHTETWSPNREPTGMTKMNIWQASAFVEDALRGLKRWRRKRSVFIWRDGRAKEPDAAMTHPDQGHSSVEHIAPVM